MKRKGQAKSKVVLGNEITRIKSIFHWGTRNGSADGNIETLVEKPVKFGDGFAKPKSKPIKRQQAEVIERHGQRTFTREEILAMLLFAPGPLEAMVLLAINCGLGNSDIGQLRRVHLNLSTGWLNYPRPKTEADRRCKLWPETVDALKDWLKVRPEPKHSDDDRFIFITKYGCRWHKETGGDNPLSHEFRKILDRLAINHHRNFYALRATYRTEAGRCADLEAIFYTMGHAMPGMAKHYVKDVHDERLTKVAECVRTWLFAPAASQHAKTATSEAPATQLADVQASEALETACASLENGVKDMLEGRITAKEMNARTRVADKIINDAKKTLAGVRLKTGTPQ
jgi:integrase